MIYDVFGRGRSRPTPSSHNIAAPFSQRKHLRCSPCARQWARENACQMICQSWELLSICLDRIHLTPIISATMKHIYIYNKNKIVVLYGHFFCEESTTVLGYQGFTSFADHQTVISMDICGKTTLLSNGKKPNGQFPK